MANVSIDVAGQLRPDLVARDVVPVTDSGPVIDGSVLEGLPGPCVPVPQPGEQIPQQVTSCVNAPSARNLRYFNSKTQIPLSTETGQRSQFVGFESVKIAGEDPVRVFFDFNTINSEFNGAGVTIIQSNTPFPENASSADITEWFDRPDTRKLRDTRSNGREATSNGQQIGRFGFDAWSSSRDPSYGEVQRLIGVENLQSNNNFAVGTDIAEPPLLDFPVAQLPIYGQNADLRCRGYGFIQTTADCRNGEYLTVFVISDINTASLFEDNDPVLWQAVVDFNTEFVAESNEPEACSEDTQNAPSRAYQQGAIINEWVGQNTYGYFGQVNQPGETAPNESDDENFIPVQPSERYLDNIYYPYEMPNPNEYLAPSGLAPGYNQDPLRSAVTGPGVTQLASRYIQSLDDVFTFGGPYRTVEIKGYFRAPVTGDYSFSASAQDGLWMWLSSRGVSNTRRVGVSEEGAEHFKQDGFNPSNSKSYNRQNYVLRVGALTANTGARTVSNGIAVTLEEGKYYFVRILAGCHEVAGRFSISYQVDTENSGNNVVGTLRFSGRSCAEDSPPNTTNPDATVPGSGGGGGGISMPGPGPGGGFLGTDAGFSGSAFAPAGFWSHNWGPIGTSLGGFGGRDRDFSVTLRDLE